MNRINMEGRPMLGRRFKYEYDKLYVQNKLSWKCVEDYSHKRLTINNKTYTLARLVYLYWDLDWDIHDKSKRNRVVHINGCDWDCSIENLILPNWRDS